MSESGLKRVIAHWAVTKYVADDTSRKHYHMIVNGNGTLVPGNLPPEANIKPKQGAYAAHTLNCNTGSIGISCAAMFGAQSVKDYGKFPITERQFDAMCRQIAVYCRKYGIPVTPKTVLSHAEVETNLGIKQRGKWDIAVLPFAGLTTAKACGDFMRKEVSKHLASPPAKAAPVIAAERPADAVPAATAPVPQQAPIAAPAPTPANSGDVHGIAGIFAEIIAAIAAYFRRK